MIKVLQKLLLKSIGGSRNERIVRGRMKFVKESVNPLEPRMRQLSDEQMLQLSADLKARRSKGESRDSIKAEAFALIREASRRARNHRQFDVQLVAGMVLDDGWIAEEATGEGKTVACYPAIYMAYLDGLHTHVVTVNDYLVQRDAEFARPVFELLGATVGYIHSGMNNAQRKPMYGCDITYGTNSEFGFDYLRDNMKLSASEQVQGPLDFAIVDEVDNILIDEARTPLIISGPAYGSTDRYRKADAVARELIARHRAWDQANRQVESLQRQIKALDTEVEKARGPERDKVQAQLDSARKELSAAEAQRNSAVQYYEVELDKKSAHMTHEGVGAAQDIAGVGSFYVGNNMEWPHLMEQSLRAHLVYERDKDYVVQNGEVIIVDEFTGRLMEGRQWSDGLHQAVEAKERVKVKDENQTLATITLQNYFKLYRKLAGMTGTALTEATEFMKIYKLDVASIPTNRPINRVDHNDRIYSDEEPKFRALVEEINRESKKGRPVLVGTTSIEKSEKLSTMLHRSYGIEHQVLNARPENAAREADIVADAGQQKPLKPGAKEMVGSVTIATNMAGRGTDIKLGPGVVYGNCKVPSADKLRELGVEEDGHYPPGSNKCCMRCPQYDPSTNCAHCFKPKIDSAFPARGRSECPQDVPCGLHIVGTERHEARRIDNQLRGRSGRQGDPGSSRFFLSIRDELMAVFAGEWTLKVLGWLGLSGDVAIEDRRVSKGIERAQKKVEERNFEIRKNLLEYDEVMNYQRQAFYSRRQMILEGRGLEGLVREMVGQSVELAAEDYLGGSYVQRVIAEWARQNLQLQIRDDQIRARDPEDISSLEDSLRTRAKEEALSVISMTLGEYMDEELDQDQWDLRGLSGWAMSRFGVNLSQTQLKRMTADEVRIELEQAANERIDQADLSPLAPMLEPDFPAQSLAQWAQAKFGFEVEADKLSSPDSAAKAIMAKVDELYHRRQIEYPVQYALDMTVGQAGGTENVYALQALADWANRKYQAGLTVESLQGRKIEDIARQLVELAAQWTDGQKLQAEVRSAVGDSPTVEVAIEFAASRFDTRMKSEDFNGDVMGGLLEAGRRFLRREMTELERFVLLQVYDSSWKDHLLAMDHLKSGISLRSYAEQDPRVAYKREGSRLFQEMIDGVREKIADMIFKVRLTAGSQMSSVYQVSNLVHEQLSAYDNLSQDMAQQQAAAQSQQKTEPIIRDVPRVGRNDPCPCGSGKKYKKCCGQE